MDKLLIIGANSFIGKYLYEHFSKQGVIGTYYNKPGENLIYFDLENPDFAFLDNVKAEYAVICSAISRIDDCKKYESKAWKINVEGTKKLIEKLFEKNIIPVFFSSDYVFDGKKNMPKEDDERNPGTVYGKHKKEIEDFLMKSNRDFLILRLSKVYGLKKDDKTLFSDMIEKISKNEINKYITDQIIAPLYVGDVVKAVDLAIEEKLTGIYNICPGEQLSWYDISLLLNKEFSLNKKIIPCSIRDFNFLDKERPLNLGLDSEKIGKELGFKFTSIKQAIEKLKKEYSRVS